MPDTIAPSAPSALGATVSKAKRVTLSWGAATDNVGVAGYRIYRNGIQIGTSAGTTFVDSLSGKRSTVTYFVRAYDAAGNLGPTSNSVTVTP